jgi:hypothetical protein
MKRSLIAGVVLLAGGALGVGGCDGQTRGSSDAPRQSEAKSPAQGGATSTAGAAGDPKNFGDTEAKKASDEQSPAGKSLLGTGSTGGPGARERQEVTIQPAAPQSPPESSP